MLTRAGGSRGGRGGSAAAVRGGRANPRGGAAAAGASGGAAVTTPNKPVSALAAAAAIGGGGSAVTPHTATPHVKKLTNDAAPATSPADGFAAPATFAEIMRRKRAKEGGGASTGSNDAAATTDNNNSNSAQQTLSFDSAATTGVTPLSPSIVPMTDAGEAPSSVTLASPALRPHPTARLTPTAASTSTAGAATTTPAVESTPASAPMSSPPTVAELAAKSAALKAQLLNNRNKRKLPAVSESPQSVPTNPKPAVIPKLDESLMPQITTMAAPTAFTMSASSFAPATFGAPPSMADVPAAVAPVAASMQIQVQPSTATSAPFSLAHLRQSSQTHPATSSAHIPLTSTSFARSSSLPPQHAFTLKNGVHLPFVPTHDAERILFETILVQTPINNLHANGFRINFTALDQWLNEQEKFITHESQHILSEAVPMQQ